MPQPDELEIFDTARRITIRDERRLYLAQASQGDVHLMARVEALLRADDDNGAFLGTPAVSLSRADTVSEGPGSQIGPYTLVEQIGEGGFGVVFLAEQKQPLRRVVAIKILKPGMDTRQIVARFEAERQALAMMDHPNIARVLDAGATPSGRPYFVMELVKGMPITRYCDEHQLVARERLKLFAAVCQAVQHAHQKGIIHRDLKPTNVLVAAYDGEPVPKVIDFGVAKALGERLTERTLITSFGGIIGTLEYMSPEQAEFNALDVDTRADIYSLGVLLYELLTGTTPLIRERLKQTAIGEALRLIREEDPPKPSTRLSDVINPLTAVSAQRKIEPELLARNLRGDLDWIVMKALDKDRDRRYQTANGLVRDIERYLHDEPVEACPPSTAYKLSKFARKHRRLLIAASAFALLLSAATAVSGWLAYRATMAERATGRERDRAEAEAERATLAERAIGRERDRAEAEAQRAQRHAYVAHMNLAQSAWEENRLGRLVALLEQHRLQIGQDDLRGFEWHYWRRLADTALVTLKGHQALVAGVAYSPDGSLLASSSQDGTAKLWEAGSGREVRTLKGHRDLVGGVAFSPDGKKLATASSDLTAKLWDASSGQELLTFKGHKRWLTSVAFNHDGTRLLSGSHDGTVKVWDAISGNELRTIDAHHGLVRAVAFSPDATFFASAGTDNTIKVWQYEGGQMVRTLPGHAGEVTSLAFAPDGTRLASGSHDRTVKLWDFATGQCLHNLDGHTERVFGVAFSADGTRIASASFDQTVRLWDAATFEQIGLFKGHAGWVSSVAFSPDGRRLASASDDRTVKVWDATAIQDATQLVLQRNSERAALAVAFCPTGMRLVSAGHDPRIKVWDVSSRQKTLALQGHSGVVTSAVFSGDGKWLASGGEDKTVRIWDAATGAAVHTLKPEIERVYAVALSTDGRRVAAAGGNGSVALWDAAAGRPLMMLRGHRSAATSVAFSPNGRWIASGSRDQTVKLWDSHTGREIRTLAGHSGAAAGVACVAFSRDSAWLASGGADHAVKIWETATGREMATLRGHIDWVSSVAFSPDGQRLASASADKTIKLWDVVSGEETLTLKGHTSLVLGVAFGPDGLRLASAGFDGSVRLWDARPWTPQLRVESEAGAWVAHYQPGCGLKSELVRRIEENRHLADDVREEALTMAQRYAEDADELNDASWRVVRQPGAAPETYALALRQAQEACRLKPGERSHLNTLGVALYRCGSFQESSDALTRLDAGRPAEKRHPASVAFLAMANFKLGQQAQARALLDDLRHLLTQPAWSGNAEDRAFLLEATELIERQP